MVYFYSIPTSITNPPPSPTYRDTKGRSAISVTGADILHTRILIFGTLFSLIFRIIQFQPGFLSLVNRCKFTATPDFSNLTIMLNQLLFSHRVVRKIRRGFMVFHDKVTYGSNPLYKDFVAATSLFLETTNRTFLRVSFSGGRSSVI